MEQPRAFLATLCRRLSHLASYQGMGTALVECVSGCKCERNILDGTWGREASLFTVMRFHVSHLGFYSPPVKKGTRSLCLSPHGTAPATVGW